MKHFFQSIFVLVVTHVCFAQHQYTITKYTQEQGIIHQLQEHQRAGTTHEFFEGNEA